MKANRASGLGSGLDVATLQSAADRQWQFVSDVTAQVAAYRVAQRLAHRAGRRARRRGAVALLRRRAASAARLAPDPGDGTTLVRTGR